MLTAKDYQSAIDSQNACNLSGIVRSWSELLGRIWDEARERDEGTDWVNRHPINRLFVEQAAHLIGAGSPRNSDSYYEAHNRCIDESKRLG